MRLFTRGTIVSVALHGVLLAALVVTLPHKKREEEPEEISITMETPGPPTQAVKAPAPAPIAAPAVRPDPVEAPPAEEPQKPQPEAVLPHVSASPGGGGGGGARRGVRKQY